jgi:isopentenyl diphosphate isomerase/L-lactate dehydrogenase-like FMN-dependent dehydrogenase
VTDRPGLQNDGLAAPEPISVFDLERTARERLPRMVWDYYASGADDGVTLADNVAAFGRRRLRYRVLAGVAERGTTTTVLGHALSPPLLVTPFSRRTAGCKVRWRRCLADLSHPGVVAILDDGAGFGGPR